MDVPEVETILVEVMDRFLFTSLRSGVRTSLGGRAGVNSVSCITGTLTLVPLLKYDPYTNSELSFSSEEDCWWWWRC